MAADQKTDNRKKKKKISAAERNRKLIFTTAAVFLFAVVGIQMGRLYLEKQKLEEEIQTYEDSITAEEERQQELIEYEVYTQSDEYVENEARTKLGQVYENEIIFREKN